MSSSRECQVSIFFSVSALVRFGPTLLTMVIRLHVCVRAFRMR